MWVILLGLCCGLVVATIGAWKDSRWEPFSWTTFIRSPLVCIAWTCVLSILFHGNSIVLIVLSAAALERISVEFWKGIIRKRPSKFSHPDRDTGWVRDEMCRPPVSNSKGGGSLPELIRFRFFFCSWAL